MELQTIVNLISNLGFPIVCVIGLGYLAWYLIKTNKEDNQTIMNKLDLRNQEREEKLYAEIAECRAINEKAINTITIYAEKLGAIQQDISEIKTDIIEIKSKS